MTNEENSISYWKETKTSDIFEESVFVLINSHCT